MAKHSKKEKGIPSSSETQSKRIRFWTRHPDWSAVIVLFLLLVVFFGPVVFSNKTLMPPDKIASLSFVEFVPQKILFSITHRYYPLWNPYLFGGMPLFASLTMPFVDVVNDAVISVAGGIQYLIHFIHPVDVKTPFYLLFNYLLLGASLYLFLRNKKLSLGASFFAATALVFMPQVIAYSAFGHNTKLATAVMIPLVFFLAERLLERQNLLFFCLTGLAVGVQFLRAHVQISYYTFLAVSMYFVYWAFGMVKDKEKIGRLLKGGLLLAGAVLAGVLISSVMNLSVLEYSNYSIRGGGETGGVSYDYATGWSSAPSEITTLFIPSFLGFGGNTYWGPLPFTDFPQYMGLLVLLFACLAAALNRNRTTWFFIILALFSLLASFGRNLPVVYGPMYKLLPLFNKFRAPNMIHILFEFSMAVLAAYGFQAVLDFPKQADKRKWKAAKTVLWSFGGILTLLLLMLVVAKGSYLNWAKKIGEGGMVAHGMAVNDAIKAVVFFAVACFLIFSALKNNLGKTGFTVILTVLLVADLWVCDKKFVQFQPKANEKAYFAETPDVTYLKGQKGPFRILPIEDGRSPNWYVYHLIQSVYGYHAAKLRIYQEALDAFQLPDQFLRKYVKTVGNQAAWRSPEEVPQVQVKAHRAFLRLLNVRYILCPYMLPDTAFHVVCPPEMQGYPAVYTFRDPLPRVFFPKRVMQIEGREAILGYMASGSFDPENVALVEEKPLFEVSASAGNEAEIVEWGYHKIVIKAKTKTPALLAVSEIYYPAGWKAFVDGKETKIYKTDYILRSVFLEPGEHSVEMVFRPRTVRIGLFVSLSSFVLLVVGTVLGYRLSRRKQAPATPAVAAN